MPTSHWLLTWRFIRYASCTETPRPPATTRRRRARAHSVPRRGERTPTTRQTARPKVSDELWMELDQPVEAVQRRLDAAQLGGDGGGAGADARGDERGYARTSHTLSKSAPTWCAPACSGTCIDRTRRRSADLSTGRASRSARDVDEAHRARAEARRDQPARAILERRRSRCGRRRRPAAWMARRAPAAALRRRRRRRRWRRPPRRPRRRRHPRGGSGGQRNDAGASATPSSAAIFVVVIIQHAAVVAEHEACAAVDSGGCRQRSTKREDEAAQLGERGVGRRLNIGGGAGAASRTRTRNGETCEELRCGAQRQRSKRECNDDLGIAAAKRFRWRVAFFVFLPRGRDQRPGEPLVPSQQREVRRGLRVLVARAGDGAHAEQRGDARRVARRRGRMGGVRSSRSATLGSAPAASARTAASWAAVSPPPPRRASVSRLCGRRRRPARRRRGGARRRGRGRRRGGGRWRRRRRWRRRGTAPPRAGV